MEIINTQKELEICNQVCRLSIQACNASNFHIGHIAYIEHVKANTDLKTLVILYKDFNKLLQVMGYMKAKWDPDTHARVSHTSTNTIYKDFPPFEQDVCTNWIETNMNPDYFIIDGPDDYAGMTEDQAMVSLFLPVHNLVFPDNFDDLMEEAMLQMEEKEMHKIPDVRVVNSLLSIHVIQMMDVPKYAKHASGVKELIHMMARTEIVGDNWIATPALPDPSTGLYYAGGHSTEFTPTENTALKTKVTKWKNGNLKPDTVVKMKWLEGKEYIKYELKLPNGKEVRLEGVRDGVS